MGLPGSRAGALLCVTWCASFPALSVGATDVKLSRKTESYCWARFQFCPMITAMPLVPNRLHGSVKLRGGGFHIQGMLSSHQPRQGGQCRAVRCRRVIRMQTTASPFQRSTPTQAHGGSCVILSDNDPQRVLCIRQVMGVAFLGQLKEQWCSRRKMEEDRRATNTRAGGVIHEVITE